MEEWSSRAQGLRCPHCAEFYLEWKGETWGVDSEPPEYGCEGVALVCGRCGGKGFVNDADQSFTVFPSMEDAEEI